MHGVEFAIANRRRRHALPGQPHDLTGLDVAVELRADEVERAGLRGHHGRSFADPQREGADSVGVPRGEDPVPREDENRVRAADLEERFGEGRREVGRLRPRHEVEDDFRVRRRGEKRAGGLELRANLTGVDEVSVVRERERPATGREHDRLGVGEMRPPGRRIPHVPDRRASGETREPRLVEDVGDVSHLALDDEPAVGEGRDARGLLAAVLERVQPEIGDVRRVLAIGDSEDAALVAKAVPGLHSSRKSSPRRCAPSSPRARRPL